MSPRHHPPCLPETTDSAACEPAPPVVAGELVYADGSDLSATCLTCDAPEIVETRDVLLEWAPLWASYLKATGVLGFFYRMKVQRAHLRVAYCAKHRTRPLARRLLAYSVLLLAAALLAIGHDLQHVPLMLSGVVLLFVFLGLVSSDSRPRPLRIQNGLVYLAPRSRRAPSPPTARNRD